MCEDPVTDLPLKKEHNYFRLNRPEYSAPVVISIPGREILLESDSGAECTSLDLIGEIKDESGVTARNLRDKVRLSLSGATASELAQRSK